jgi:hypothetical protein
MPSALSLPGAFIRCALSAELPESKRLGRTVRWLSRDIPDADGDVVPGLRPLAFGLADPDQPSVHTLQALPTVILRLRQPLLK